MVYVSGSETFGGPSLQLNPDEFQPALRCPADYRTGVDLDGFGW